MDVTHQHLVFEGHAVLAYDQEAALSSTVPAVLASAGFCGGIVLVATDQHRSAVLDGLAQLTDLDALESAQRIVVLEASEALDRIMVHGQPDPERFASVIGSPIRALAATGPVIAFGEMVALLWDAGEIGAVLELEDLWNGSALRCRWIWCAGTRALRWRRVPVARCPVVTITTCIGPPSGHSPVSRSR